MSKGRRCRCAVSMPSVSANTRFRARPARPTSASKGRMTIYGSAKAVRTRSAASIRALRTFVNSRCRRPAQCRSGSCWDATAISGSRRRKLTRSAVFHLAARLPNSSSRHRMPVPTVLRSAPTATCGFPKLTRDRSAASRLTEKSPSSKTASHRAASRCRSSCATATYGSARPRVTASPALPSTAR